jgi:uncharacterized membrane protein
MNRKRLTVPKKGLPAWVLPDDPDTAWHARARVALYCVAALVFACSLLTSVIPSVYRSWPKSMWVGCLFIAFFLPRIHYGVRPGQGKIWLISLGVLALAAAFPPLSLLLFFVPLAFLAKAMWRSLHPKKSDRDLHA